MMGFGHNYEDWNSLVGWADTYVDFGTYLDNWDSLDVVA